MKRIFELDFYGRKIVVESGELAKQTNGSVLVRYGDTVVLTAAVMSNIVSERSFFPLTIVYNEKLYSVGKIPGGFIKRETRPSDNATLTARLIDRPIRPLFDENFRNEVQVINTVLSVDQDNTPEMTALFGSSLSLMISDIPFDGPVAGVNVGLVDDEFIINPNSLELEKSKLHLSVAGTKQAINMVEADAQELSEETMLEALMFGHEAIKKLITFQEEIVNEIGKEKLVVELAEIDAELDKEVRDFVGSKMLEAIQIKEKLEKYAAIEQVKNDTVEHFTNVYEENEELEGIIKQVNRIVDNIEFEEVRMLITDKGIRPDGRKMNEIRDLSAQIDLLPRTHGSALFTRGQTQALATTTLGAIGEHQILDGLGLEDMKRFMLHYNFPPFSVGETGRYGAPGRREIGHGALGERALAQVMPSEEEFPYTIRVVSEILESNGSSSQASICAGCLSLMAAGVPIKSPVAGIAMGLITKDDKYQILTDIQGLEDHMGDMDFKVAGTRSGICALQMDIKIEGLSREILEEALQQAKVGRMQILNHMLGTIAETREDLSAYAPKIKVMTIKVDKIRDVIGPGGKQINEIIDKTGVKIDIEQDGTVYILHDNTENINQAVAMIEDIVREVEVGKIYLGKVVRIEKFGAFVEIFPGQDGLVHISQLAEERVAKTEDVVNVGDQIHVKVTEIDDRGRVNLSRKEAMKEQAEQQAE